MSAAKRGKPSRKLRVTPSSMRVDGCNVLIDATESEVRLACEAYRGTGDCKQRPFAANAFVYRIACALRLPNPIGRTAYVLNRARNTWPHVKEKAIPGAYRGKSYVEVMRSCREATAAKWEAHWLGGGSLKKLGVTEDEYRAEQRARREALLSEADRLRLYVRRARKAGREAS